MPRVVEPALPLMKLLLCDDHAVFRDGLKGALEQLGASFLDASTADEGLAALEREPDVDALLLDLSMPGGDPWETLARFRSEQPSVPAIIVSGSEEPETVRRAIDAGASGFIPKSSTPAVFRAAIELVLSGGVYLPPQILAASGSAATPALAPTPRHANRDRLTGRQRDVAGLISKGLTNSEIASVLQIAEGTVKTHISAILETLDVTNRTEAVLAIQEIDGDD